MTLQETMKAQRKCLRRGIIDHETYKTSQMIAILHDPRAAKIYRKVKK